MEGSAPQPVLGDDRGLRCLIPAASGRPAPARGGEFVTDRRTGEQLPSWLGWKHIVIEEPEAILRYAEETRRSWVEASLALIGRVTVPVVFSYYSRRAPDYAIDMEAVAAQAGEIRAGRDNGAFVEGLMGDSRIWWTGRAGALWRKRPTPMSNA